MEKGLRFEAVDCLPGADAMQQWPTAGYGGPVACATEWARNLRESSTHFPRYPGYRSILMIDHNN
jgi:hypothetical protein